MDFVTMEKKLYALRAPQRKGADHPEFFKALRGATGFMEPEKNIVVVGTNGKGTTSQLIFHTLRAQGYKAGLFTSPHLVHLKERLRYQDRYVTEEELLELFQWVIDRHKSEPFSFFQVLTLMAVEWFKNIQSQDGLDFVVWEAGLGGRFDPAAQVPHALTVLTTISLDHQELLGSTLEQIASNKLGAVSKEGALISHPPAPEWEGALKAELAQKKARWIQADHWGAVQPAANLKEAAQSFHTPWGPVSVQLLGEMARSNLQLALTAARWAAGEELRNLGALKDVKFWGRGQWVRGFKAPVLLSGDHNQEGWEHLARELKRQGLRGVIYYRLSKASKASIFESTFSELTDFRLVPSQVQEFAANGQEAAEALKQEFSSVLSSVSDSDTVVVSGSLYFIGDWLKACGFQASSTFPETLSKI